MTLSQTITLDYAAEMQNTRRLLERIPVDDAHRHFRPHPKSGPLDGLATHLAEIPGWIKMALESPLLEIPASYKPTIAGSTDELLAIFDRAAAEGRQALDAATDEDMQQIWTFRYGSDFTLSEVRTKVVRDFLNHLIHHRAQLTVYLRLMNIPVPGMYGPSADEM